MLPGPQGTGSGMGDKRSPADELRYKQEAVLQAAREWTQARRWSKVDENKSFEHRNRVLRAEINLHDATDRLYDMGWTDTHK